MESSVFTSVVVSVTFFEFIQGELEVDTHGKKSHLQSANVFWETGRQRHVVKEGKSWTEVR